MNYKVIYINDIYIYMHGNTMNYKDRYINDVYIYIYEQTFDDVIRRPGPCSYRVVHTLPSART